MLAGCPFLNSIVRRSYPACVPTRTASMYADGGACVVVGVNTEQIKGAGETPGLGLGVGMGVGEGAAEGVGVFCPGPCETNGPRFSGLATSRTPTTMTAITAAARAAIHTGPRLSGASTRAERTRSGRAGLGGPLIDSNASPSSRRKSSRVTSEHLLWGEVRSPLAGCSVNA